LHVHHTDDVLQDDGGRRRVDRCRAFGVGQCPNGAVEEAPFFLEHVSLLTKDGRERQRLAIEQGTNVVQRKSDGLEGQDLLELDEV